MDAETVLLPRGALPHLPRLRPVALGDETALCSGVVAPRRWVFKGFTPPNGLVLKGFKAVRRPYVVPAMMLEFLMSLLFCALERA